MTVDTSLPPALFDVTEEGDLTPPLFEPAGHGVGLTPFGAHEGLVPGVWDDFPGLCGTALYASVQSSGRRVWIHHVCSQIGEHDEHDCDRCTHTWKDHPCPSA